MTRKLGVRVTIAGGYGEGEEVPEIMVVTSSDIRRDFHGISEAALNGTVVVITKLGIPCLQLYPVKHQARGPEDMVISFTDIRREFRRISEAALNGTVVVIAKRGIQCLQLLPLTYQAKAAPVD